MARTPRGESQVTIGDVARLAGVSRATASRALNDSDKVVPATKQRVRAAADKIGFVMNARARGLALGRAEAIAILFTEPLDEMFADPTYATLVRGIHEALAPTSTMPVLMQASSDFERARVLQRFRQRLVDAVIPITPYIGEDLLSALDSEPIPVVICGQPSSHGALETASHVYANDTVGAELAARHLAGRGCRRVAVINGPRTNPAATERLAGYRSALGPLLDSSLCSFGQWDSESGARQTRDALAREPRLDGILAANDRLAVGALSALRDAGLRTPDDVAVVGFDDNGLAETTRPPLTTVRQPLLQQGERAARMALDMIEGADPRDEVLDMSLTVRESA